MKPLGALDVPELAGELGVEKLLGPELNPVPELALKLLPEELKLEPEELKLVLLPKELPKLPPRPGLLAPPPALPPSEEPPMLVMVRT